MNVFTILFVAALTVAAASAGDGDILDQMDLEAMVQNEEQRKAIVDCMLDKVPCGDLQKLKDLISKLIETKCGQCTPPQKEKYERVSTFMKEKHPQDFNAVMSKYEPQSQ